MIPVQYYGCAAVPMCPEFHRLKIMRILTVLQHSALFMKPLQNLHNFYGLGVDTVTACAKQEIDHLSRSPIRMCANASASSDSERIDWQAHSKH